MIGPDANSFLIGVDDTDNPDEGGTGRLCRVLAEVLAGQWRVGGVTRHQLPLLPGIPYTRRNSANALHFTCPAQQFAAAFAEAVRWIAEHCWAGSSPGVCGGSAAALSAVTFGRTAQERIVTPQEAYEAAETAQVTLKAAGGDGHGVIGALAAAALAASGNDGRFIAVGTVRALTGLVAAARVRAAGVDQIRSTTGAILIDGYILADAGLRPALREGQSILFVEWNGHHWLPVRGAPDDDSIRSEHPGATT